MEQTKKISLRRILTILAACIALLVLTTTCVFWYQWQNAKTTAENIQHQYLIQVKEVQETQDKQFAYGWIHDDNSVGWCSTAVLFTVAQPRREVARFVICEDNIEHFSHTGDNLLISTSQGVTYSKNLTNGTETFGKGTSDVGSTIGAAKSGLNFWNFLMTKWRKFRYYY